MDCMFLAVGMAKWGLKSPVLMVMVLLIGIVFGMVQGYCAAYLEIQPFIRPTVIVALLVVLLVYLMLKYTKFGRSIYAVGGNQVSATLMGLNVRKTKLLTYTLRSFLTSIGGTLLTGGVGNVLGSLVGVLINGTISTLVKSNGKLVSSWANIITAILLCFFILLQAVFAKIKESKKA